MAHIKVGTRGSKLALSQCTAFVNEMRTKNPSHTFELVIIKTTGDLNQTSALSSFGSQGVFVKELENALFAGEIDCAVHSLKDVPHALPEGLEISVFSKRENPYDVFISDGRLFNELPAGSTIGTGSVRRRILLQALRSDLEYRDIRGNIETRIGKVTQGELDGVILAAAGLNRIDDEYAITQEFEKKQLIPAIGQGVLGVETRVGDSAVVEILRSMNDSDVENAMAIERGFMKEIGGGCKAPMAAFAEVQNGQCSVAAMIANQVNGESVRFEKQFTHVRAAEIVEEMVSFFTDECTKKSIPLPSELEDHQLLR